MASESSFSVRDWVTDEIRAKLLLDIVETLVTTDY